MFQSPHKCKNSLWHILSRSFWNSKPVRSFLVKLGFDLHHLTSNRCKQTLRPVPRVALDVVRDFILGHVALLTDRELHPALLLVEDIVLRVESIGQIRDVSLWMECEPRLSARFRFASFQHHGQRVHTGDQAGDRGVLNSGTEFFCRRRRVIVCGRCTQPLDGHLREVHIDRRVVMAGGTQRVEVLHLVRIILELTV